ncbi:DUF1461 domain-containing protein [Agaribacterium haliotis]|uniref:lipoprotein intramolecular transacylase Lit n=1 Tax=Agaribacterium haliotis TaxID=2013869 RepID=UPI000BB57B05|nr:DUF1461 domain-containing protein [Agaribacterium haliotis]
MALFVVLRPMLFKLLYSLSILLLSLSLAWLLLAPLNFLYPLWHDYGVIEQGIERYAPENRYKAGFADTSAEQRYELFAQINRAIHQHGEGLAQISYESATSGGPQLLLREPEVVHLQDVANLMDVLAWVVAANIALFVLLLFWGRRTKGLLPGVKQVLAFNLALIVLLTALVLMIGPTAVFNQLHIWVFPAEHQWFFYYQESLMSTMMLAPVLFAYIAGLLLLVSVLILLMLVFGLRRLSESRR